MFSSFQTFHVFKIFKFSNFSGHDLLLGSDEQLLQVVWPLHWNLVLGDRNGFNGAIRSTPAPSRWSPAGKARRTTPTGDSTTSIQPARLGQLYDWHYHRYGHGDHYWLMFENVKKVLPLSPIIILNSNVRSGHSTGGVYKSLLVINDDIRNYRMP